MSRLRPCTGADVPEGRQRSARIPGSQAARSVPNSGGHKVGHNFGSDSRRCRPPGTRRPSQESCSG